MDHPSIEKTFEEPAMRERSTASVPAQDLEESSEKSGSGYGMVDTPITDEFQALMARFAKLKEENAAPEVQALTFADFQKMLKSGVGLRHLSTLDEALQNQSGGATGDAVPLNPMGKADNALMRALMGIDEKRVDKAAVEKAMEGRIKAFISGSLDFDSTGVEVGKTTAEEFCASFVERSSFLLLDSLEGVSVPKDADKYAGLGKAGKQKFKPAQVQALLIIDKSDLIALELQFLSRWTSPMSREDTEETQQAIVDVLYSKIVEVAKKL